MLHQEDVVTASRKRDMSYGLGVLSVIAASRKRDMSLTQVRCCHQAGGCCHSFEEEGYEFDS